MRCTTLLTGSPSNLPTRRFRNEGFLQTPHLEPSLLRARDASPAKETEQGEAVFCDTQAQVEQFAAAYYDSGSIPDAVKQANLAAPHACAPLRAAFIRGEQVKAITIKQGTVHLYEVLVVGVWRGQWGKVAPTIQYIAVLDKEERA